MAVCEFCGQEMLTAKGCIVKKVYCDGKAYDRLRVGDEGEYEYGERCTDCGALYGHYHHWGCDNEHCPACGGQMLGCACKEVYIKYKVRK